MHSTCCLGRSVPSAHKCRATRQATQLTWTLRPCRSRLYHHTTRSQSLGSNGSGSDESDSIDSTSLRPLQAYTPPSEASSSHSSSSGLPSNGVQINGSSSMANGSYTNGSAHQSCDLQDQPVQTFSHSSESSDQSRRSNVRLRAAKGGPALASSDEDGPLKLMSVTNPTGGESTPGTDESPDLGTFWGLLILGLAYVHHSTTGFALPALLPLITPELQLTDTQGSMLTAGYTVLYALALVPVGFLADKADRPRLLAAGLTMWSILTMLASKVHGFGELLATRIFFAMAQATQNPICFSLIPELFRKDRTTAMAGYNSAIYIGRALSFAAVIVAGKLGMAANGGDVGVTMVPLDSLDLSHVSILYTQGEMAAITPIYDYQFSILDATVTISSWRQLLSWLGPPGLALALLALLTLDEPRKPTGNFLGDVFASSKFTTSSTRDLNRSSADQFSASDLSAQKKKKEAEKEKESIWQSVKDLMSSPVFQAVTLASAFNDVGSWALVSWQATFYQRVYELSPDVYAPALAGILPIGGIIGGVGGGLMGDWLSKRGGLQILTSGATIAACPVLVGNILAPESSQSFAFLLFGFALSEMWRAPAAIMIRDVSPPNLGSTGSAVHLCIRNLVGGLGPISVAALSKQIGLQYAMLLVPICYFLSGVTFFFAHKIQDAEGEKVTAAASE